MKYAHFVRRQIKLPKEKGDNGPFSNHCKGNGKFYGAPENDLDENNMSVPKLCLLPVAIATWIMGKDVAPWWMLYEHILALEADMGGKAKDALKPIKN